MQDYFEYILKKHGENIDNPSVKIHVNKTENRITIILIQSTTDAIKTTLKRAIQKAVEATDDLIGNKIADKITSVSKKSSTEHSKNDDANTEIEVPRKRYISPEERRQIIDELRLL